jgi:hypothetical protein
MSSIHIKISTFGILKNPRKHPDDPIFVCSAK